MVPGSANNAVPAILHGSEIVVPPEDSGARQRFVSDLAAALGSNGAGDDRPSVNVTIQQLTVQAPPGSTVTERIAAAATEAAIEALIS